MFVESLALEEDKEDDAISLFDQVIGLMRDGQAQVKTLKSLPKLSPRLTAKKCEYELQKFAGTLNEARCGHSRLA